MKLRMLSAIALLVIATLFVAMFVCLVSLNKIVDQNQNTDDSGQQVGDAIGLIVLLPLALLLAISWFILAITFLIYGLIMLLKRNLFSTSAKGLIALIVLSAVFGIPAIWGLVFTYAIFEIYTSPVMFFALALIALYVANFILQIVNFSATKKQARENVLRLTEE